LDYEEIKKNNQKMHDELLETVMEPSRVSKLGGREYLRELFGD